MPRPIKTTLWYLLTAAGATAILSVPLQAATQVRQVFAAAWFGGGQILQFFGGLF